MRKYDIEKMQHQLKKHMDAERFHHTLGVMYTSAALAMRYQANLEHAQVAGLLHDCAKTMPNEKKIKFCQKRSIEISESEMQNPFLLHAKVGASIAEEKYGIHEEEILSAIRYHTTGRPDMSLMEKIVYIADFIEPWRFKANNLQTVRDLAFRDIDETLCIILKDMIIYLKNQAGIIDDMTEMAYNYYIVRNNF